jgi:hypothetical protein
VKSNSGKPKFILAKLNNSAMYRQFPVRSLIVISALILATTSSPIDTSISTLSPRQIPVCVPTPQGKCTVAVDYDYVANLAILDIFDCNCNLIGHKFPGIAVGSTYSLASTLPDDVVITANMYNDGQMLPSFLYQGEKYTASKEDCVQWGWGNNQETCHIWFWCNSEAEAASHFDGQVVH